MSVDSQQYVYSLARDAADLGVDFFTGYEVQEIEQVADDHVLRTSQGSLRSRYVVNAAGLHADELAHKRGIGKR